MTSSQGTLTRTENGARWGSDRQARVLTENPKTGNYSLRFFYPGTGPALVLNYWPRPSGESHLILFAGGPQKPDGSGQMFRKNYWDEGGQIFEIADRGKWLTIIVHAKYATPANDDGTFRLWKVRDGETIPVLDKTDDAWYVPGQPGFDQGYLLGQSNSGFAEDTIFYIDNIKFSTTSLLEGPGGGEPPAPPGGSGTFTDDDASFFEPYIEKVATSGITLGCTSGPDPKFCPDDVVTRGQMAAFLTRALGL